MVVHAAPLQTSSATVGFDTRLSGGSWAVSLSFPFESVCIAPRMAMWRSGSGCSAAPLPLNASNQWVAEDDPRWVNRPKEPSVRSDGTSKLTDPTCELVASKALRVRVQVPGPAL